MRRQRRILRKRLHGQVGGRRERHRMAAVAVAEAPDTTVGRAPTPAALAAIAFLGLTAGALTFALALTSDDVNEPGLRAALMNWVTLPYIFGGLVAWWRRPDSR